MSRSFKKTPKKGVLLQLKSRTNAKRTENFAERQRSRLERRNQFYPKSGKYQMFGLLIRMERNSSRNQPKKISGNNYPPFARSREFGNAFRAVLFSINALAAVVFNLVLIRSGSMNIGINTFVRRILSMVIF